MRDSTARRHRVLRDREDRLHERARVIDELLQLVAIGVEIGDRPRRHAALHRGLRHRGRDARDQARIERLGNQVFGTERKVGDAVGRCDDIALLLLRQRGDRLHRRNFHRCGDRRRADIERAAEDERKAQDVVDLIRIVRAARWR